MAGRVAASAKPVVIRDLDQVELASPHLRERGIKSLVAIPIMVGEQVIGVAHAGSVETAQFDEADMRLLRLMADRIALAMTQAQAYEDERQARHEAELAHRRLAFLAEASTLLATSLDYESTLRAVARLAVPHLADWCVVDVAVENSQLERIAVAHIDPDKIGLVAELERRWPPQETDPIGPYAVCAAARPSWRPRFPRRCSSGRPTTTSTSRSSATSASARTCACRCGGGTASSARSPSSPPSPSAATRTPTSRSRRSWRAGRQSPSTTRCSTAQAEERARAARVLDAVGDGVFLIDSRGIDPALEPGGRGDHGPAAEDVARPARRPRRCRAGRRSSPRDAGRLRGDRAVARAETVPLELGGRELWLSISGVGFADGTVYAFRDLTAGARARGAEGRLRLDHLPRAAHAACRRLRRGDDAAARRHRSATSSATSCSV